MKEFCHIFSLILRSTFEINVLYNQKQYWLFSPSLFHDHSNRNIILILINFLIQTTCTLNTHNPHRGRGRGIILFNVCVVFLQLEFKM